eukprot:343235-Chlamydomonas_euryale.AAC.1
MERWGVLVWDVDQAVGAGLAPLWSQPLWLRWHRCTFVCSTGGECVERCGAAGVGVWGRGWTSDTLPCPNEPTNHPTDQTKLQRLCCDAL